MTTFVLRRVLISVPVLWGVLTATFFGFRLIAGNPVDIILGTKGSAADRIRLYHELGLDRPLFSQYLDFLRGAIHFDFGASYATRQPVWNEISLRLPYTVELALTAFVVATLIGVVAGSVSALFSRRSLGHTVTFVSVLGISLPTYVLGTLLALVFGVDLHILPVAGPGDAKNLVLPSVTLAVPLAAV